MWKKLVSYFSENYSKFILVAVLIPLILVVDRMEFPKIDAFIRDSLQFLNSSDEVDKRIVTVNIDTFDGKLKKPFESEDVVKLIESISSHHAKSIILAIEPSEIRDFELKKQLIFQSFSKFQNLFLDVQDKPLSFYRDPVFAKYPRFFNMKLGLDESFGAHDGKHRRAIISFDSRGVDPIFSDLKKIGFEPVSTSQFEYSFNFWNTTQVLLKTFPEGSFGNLDAKSIISDPNINLSQKLVIVGSFDEYSFLAKPSVFNIFGKTNEKFGDIYFPYADTLANSINLYVTGNYIKYVSSNNIYNILITLMALIILSNFDLRKKIILIFVTIPLILIGTIFIYVLKSEYIDFSKFIVFVLLLQYFGAPILLVSFLSKTESKKLRELAEARIDALLMVAENVAHDIRSPLSAVNIIVSRAKFRSEEEFEILKNSLGRIDQAAANILNKYKSDFGANYDQPEHFNLFESVKIIYAEKILNFPHIALDNSTTDAIVRGYSIEIQRVISNIIDNSVNALEGVDKPEIKIRVVAQGKYITVIISDNGCGIDSRVLIALGKLRINKPEGTSKGSGIGLLHAKRIVERMAGKFEIQTNPKIGTVVSVSLLKLSISVTLGWLFSC